MNTQQPENQGSLGVAPTAGDGASNSPNFASQSAAAPGMLTAQPDSPAPGSYSGQPSISSQPSPTQTPRPTSACHPNSAPAASQTPPRSRGRSGCLVTSVVLLSIALVCCLAALFLALCALGASNKSFSGTTAKQSYQATVIDEVSTNSKEQVVVLPIIGTIMDYEDVTGNSFTSSTEIQAVLDYISEQDNIKAVILDINSPGGGVTASDKIYHKLAKFKKESGLPIVALFEDMACSGGYYVAMGADQLIAHPTSFTGSIGVIMQMPEVSDLLDHIGVEMVTVTSLNSQGQPSFKDMGSPFRKMSPKERAMFQEMITQSWNRFVEVVAEGRKGKLDIGQVRKLADGRVYTSKQALASKLIDKIGYSEDAYSLARKLGKCPQANIVMLQRDESLFRMLTKPSMHAADLRRLSQYLGPKSSAPVLQYRTPIESYER